MTIDKDIIVVKEGHVRVDLLGGTLDLSPIGLILNKAITLNLALSLKIKVELEMIENEQIEIYSEDYRKKFIFSRSAFTQRNLLGDFFGPMKLIAHILNYFKCYSKISIRICSEYPHCAGLGGSSTMAVTLYLALCELLKIDVNFQTAIKVVQEIESIILDAGPSGFQDYYPAIFGGILSLRTIPGKVIVEQLFNKTLKRYLEERMTLIYSGEMRHSGVNNWEIYQKFFNKDASVRRGLTEIAELADLSCKAIREKNYKYLIDLIKREGKCRQELFSGILTSKIEKFFKDSQKILPRVKIKICGAGGGGCFLLLHEREDSFIFDELIVRHGMKKLDFIIQEPQFQVG